MISAADMPAAHTTRREWEVETARRDRDAERATSDALMDERARLRLQVATLEQQLAARTSECARLWYSVAGLVAVVWFLASKLWEK
jgi:hypothetical protein